MESRQMSTEKKHRYLSLQFLFALPSSLMFFILSSLIYLMVIMTFNTYATDQANSNLKTLSKQVISNYNSYFSSVIKVSDAIQNKVNYLDLSSSKNDVASYFDEILNLQKEVYSISIYSYSDDAKGKMLVSDSSYNDDGSYVSEEAWFSNAVKNPLVNVFSPVTSSTDNEFRFTVSKLVYYSNEQKEGVMKMEYSFTKIVNLISQTDLGQGGNVIIFDKDNFVVYTSALVIPQEERKLAISTVLGTSSYADSGSSYLLYVSTIENTTWRAAIAMNNDALGQAINRFTLFTLLGTSIGVLLFSLISYLTARQISSPLADLNEKMRKVESLNYQADALETESQHRQISKEVHELSNSFDQMMKRINELNIKNIKEEEDKRMSELKALQNQINPHFLYNTMDSIIYLIEKKENDKAEEMIMALSKFFRISISRGKNVIPLSSEMEHAKNYLIIQKIRYGQAFDYTIESEPGIEKYYVIKLILQPIVENAIVHGIEENADHTSSIAIREFVKEGFIYLEVNDNGYGILPDKVEEIYKSFKDDKMHSGVGLKNVYQRMKIYYGESADIIIDSVLDKGTKITLKIPEQGALKDEE